MVTDMVEEAAVMQDETLNIQEILDTIPHRYPFLLVDRVTSHEVGRSITGYKNVSINEPFFQGHFPHNPIMPGVLIVEAMAQMGAILVAHMPEGRGKLTMFAGIDHMRFRRPVLPGDRLDLKGELIKFKGSLGKAHVTAWVEGELVAEGELLFSVVPYDFQRSPLHVD